MMMVSVVLGLVLIGLLLLGQKMAQKAAVRNKKTAPAATAAAAALSAVPAEPEAQSVPVAQHYRSDKVGNDSSALPWEQRVELEPAAATAISTQSASDWAQLYASPLSARPDQLPDRMPAHFDLALLLERSKEAFMRLHTAWEEGDAAAVRELLVPSIWQQVEAAMQVQALPDWGQRIGEVQHLAARALEAQAGDDGRVRVRMEFTGGQLHAADGKLRPIHEVWDVRYEEQPPLWQIADLHSKSA